MEPREIDLQLSAPSLDVLGMICAAKPTERVETPPSVPMLVRYASGALSIEEASQVEISLSRNLDSVSTLVEVFREVESLRQVPWQTLLTHVPQNHLTTQILDEWKIIVGASIPEIVPFDFNLAGLCNGAQYAEPISRLTKRILEDLADPSLAPGKQGTVSQTRFASAAPAVKGLDPLIPIASFCASIDSALDLVLEVTWHQPPVLDGEKIAVAFQLTRQWVQLGSIGLTGSEIRMVVPGFGDLLGLTEGILPPDLFALSLEKTGEAIAPKSWVVQAGNQSFAEIEAGPLLELDFLSMDIRLLSHSPELQHAKAIELWFGTGSQVWQLLGRWPVAQAIEGKMLLSCPSPKPGLQSAIFPGILKLTLQH
jgi:hypothetical protein